VKGPRGAGELWGARRSWEALRERTGRAEGGLRLPGLFEQEKRNLGAGAGGRQESLGLIFSRREALPSLWGSVCGKSFALMPGAVSSSVQGGTRSDEWEGLGN